MIAKYKGKTYECSFFKGKILLSSNRNKPGFSKDLDGYIKIGDIITWEYESGKVDKNNKPIYEYHASIWKGNDEIWECMDPNGVRTRQYSTYYKWMNEHNHKINKVKYFRFKES